MKIKCFGRSSLQKTTSQSSLQLGSLSRYLDKETNVGEWSTDCALLAFLSVSWATLPYFCINLLILNFIGVHLCRALGPHTNILPWHLSSFSLHWACHCGKPLSLVSCQEWKACPFGVSPLEQILSFRVEWTSPFTLAATQITHFQKMYRPFRSSSVQACRLLMLYNILLRVCLMWLYRGLQCGCEQPGRPRLLRLDDQTRYAWLIFLAVGGSGHLLWVLVYVLSRG